MLSVFSGGLQAPGGAAFPGLLSFPAGVPGFSSNTAPAALSGLHNPAVQSALLQVPMIFGHTSQFTANLLNFTPDIPAHTDYETKCFIFTNSFSIVCSGALDLF